MSNEFCLSDKPRCKVHGFHVHDGKEILPCVPDDEVDAQGKPDHPYTQHRTMGRDDDAAERVQPEPVSPAVKCGKFAASFIPRLGQYFACVLDVGHEGECRPGGTCIKHGAYVGEPNVTPQCPKWPDCIDHTVLVASESAPKADVRTTSPDLEQEIAEWWDRKGSRFHDDTPGAIAAFVREREKHAPKL